MPTYEYRRKDGSTFEVFQPITAEPLTEDPETGEPVERVISGGVGLQFKGSGFYLTDYAQSSGKGADDTSTSTSTNGEAASPASDSSATETTSGDSKSGSGSKAED
ncbi:MAG: FmdB family zinc ribbon protein [Rubricoccaceae bacterium]|nr:FmdB family zinc ribbon protein [Rubricoccaceae bacterium]